MPPRESIPAGPPGQDFANRWLMNDLGVENTRVQNWALKHENASLRARLRCSKNRERDLQRELVEKDDILAVSTAQANEIIAAVQEMMMQMVENRDHGDGNGVDRVVENEGGMEFAGNGRRRDNGSNGGVRRNEAENNPLLERLDNMLKIQEGMLNQMISMQAEIAKVKQYPKWRDWKYWKRKLVVAAPAGVWMLLAGYLGNLLAGYTGIYLYPKK